MEPSASRVGAVRDALARLHLDAILITALPNIRYLTGFSGSNGLLLISARSATLFTDFRYETQVELEVAAGTDVRIERHSVWAGLWTFLPAQSGVERVGFESAHLLHSDFQRLLEQGARWTWRPAVGVVEALRERKDAAEVEAIVRAVAMAESALTATLTEIHPGLTETQVAGVLEHRLRDAGSEGFPFESIVASGPRSALPHARASDRPLQVGDFLLLDFGAIADGYCSDITRTFVLGTASAEQRELYDVVREANARASGALRVGLTGMAADQVARDYIADRGHGAAFGHSLGHGIGLEVHEAPRLAKSVEAPLVSGAVVTIEPGIYRPGWGGVRIEDDVLVSEAGPRLLTTFPRDLREL
ncbi:MAG: Xaa-Pro peptidase family protein [Gemmatimonadaceae bacterium]